MSASPRLQLRQHLELPDYPLDAAWSADGQLLLIAGGEGALLLLQPRSTEAARQLGMHRGGVLAVTWQKAGRLFASSGQDGTVLLWDSRSLQARPIHQGKDWSEQLSFADNGRHLAVASARHLRLFGDHGALVRHEAEHPGTIAALAWRPKSNEIAAAGNGGVRIHSVDPAIKPRDFPWQGACLGAAWSPDGRILATGMQDGSVQLWNMASGTRSERAGYGSKVIATEWNSSGRYLATAAGSSIVIWDCSARGGDSARPLELNAHSERLSALRFRPGGSLLVSAAHDRRLLLWRVGVEDTPTDAHLLAEQCTFLRFSRDGRQLAAGDARGGLYLFDLAA